MKLVITILLISILVKKPEQNKDTVQLRAEIVNLSTLLDDTRQMFRLQRKDVMRLSREIYYINNPNVTRLAEDNG